MSRLEQAGMPISLFKGDIRSSRRFAVFQAMEHHWHDEDQQREGGGPYVKVVAREEAVDAVSHGGQRLRFRGEIAVEVVAFLKEMTGHAEHEFDAEDRGAEVGVKPSKNRRQAGFFLGGFIHFGGLCQVPAKVEVEKLANNGNPRENYLVIPTINRLFGVA